MMTPERLNEIASKPLVEITQREFDCVAIAAREGLEAQEQLKPRNGHTFESLQKMWEDTHIELAKTISERNEAKVELGAYKAIIDRAFEAMKDPLHTNENFNVEIERIVKERNEARYKLDASEKRELEMREAAYALIKRMNHIYNDPLYCSVWASFAVHGGNYSKGPTWEKEVKVLKEALSTIPQSEPREAR